MTFTEGAEEFDPRDWERVDAMVALGVAADQDVAQLGEALSVAVRDVASVTPNDGRLASDGYCPPWPLRAALLRQPMQPTVEAEVVVLSAHMGQGLPPRLLTYYMGLLMQAGRPSALTTDRALVRARNAMAAVSGAQGLSVLPVPPRPEMAALFAEDSHFVY
ncbi:hypothetical protein ETD86_11540 [Nonomuraea turkmeniaca]|uniref:Uncharacterized protein n=1 Tax=Nonomuraea turkmeniaca TaxID=103838 RepID=A0A5S4FP43_9ACTN|nr:hypothetical protein [Nonomuraea turkmeniaca]TMR22473.1 hypothetical protein ETD86_11540 [Nonomuraea turkmeniaca]